MPSVVARFISLEGRRLIVRFPTFYEEYYNPVTRTMKRYFDELKWEDIKEAKKWLRNHGFRWVSSLHAWVKDLEEPISEFERRCLICGQLLVLDPKALMWRTKRYVHYSDEAREKCREKTLELINAILLKAGKSEI
jgi:hypothetical protein